MSDTRQLVAQLLGEGLTQAEIARRIGITPATVCHHARALGIAPDARFSRRCDWAAIQRYYDAGHSISARMTEFGFAKKTWHEARLRGERLSLALHHVNGDPRDNRLENLQLLCPNCHSQTENFAGRNLRRRRVA